MYMSLQSNYSPTGPFVHFLIFFFIILWPDSFLHKALRFLISSSGKIAGDRLTGPTSRHTVDGNEINTCICSLEDGSRSPSPAVGTSGAHFTLPVNAHSFDCVFCPLSPCEAVWQHLVVHGQLGHLHAAALPVSRGPAAGPPAQELLACRREHGSQVSQHVLDL